ncbi:hypothetical protein BNJ_00453 [Kaumoebavirus]|uniref:hypothetical protein n=1 Tax=Kaumoebavirus TaxID=1859492 RepID=UPI0009C28D9E|nr:hypothetical protein BNJ_00453 [Kaumoebavirus]ARA72265.1 hypothetical protein BNJ_00453 [Kaumoebavirus]
MWLPTEIWLEILRYVPDRLSCRAVCRLFLAGNEEAAWKYFESQYGRGIHKMIMRGVPKHFEKRVAAKEQWRKWLIECPKTSIGILEKYAKDFSDQDWWVVSSNVNLNIEFVIRWRNKLNERLFVREVWERIVKCGSMLVRESRNTMSYVHQCLTRMVQKGMKLDYHDIKGKLDRLLPYCYNLPEEWVEGENASTVLRYCDLSSEFISRNTGRLFSISDIVKARICPEDWLEKHAASFKMIDWEHVSAQPLSRAFVEKWGDKLDWRKYLDAMNSEDCAELFVNRALERPSEMAPVILGMKWTRLVNDMSKGPWSDRYHKIVECPHHAAPWIKELNKLLGGQRIELASIFAPKEYRKVETFGKKEAKVDEGEWPVAGVGGYRMLRRYW